MNKAEQRKMALALRNHLPQAERERCSAAICAHLYANRALREAQTIAAYYPLGSEVDLRPLLAAWESEGKRIALPISYAGGIMVFHEAELARLEQGLYGIFQPPEQSREIAPSEIDAILIPGAAFDETGGRIGYGKGYYDRILHRFDGLTVGVCFSAQCTERICAEPHDVPMQYLADENGIHSIKREDNKNER